MKELLNTQINEPKYIPQSGWHEHGPFAMWLVKKTKPRSIVELGSHYGFSYFAMCQAVVEDSLQTKCWAIDTWIGDEHAGYYKDTVFKRVETQNQQYNTFSNLVRKTFAAALDDIEDQSVDILHVDGRHFYDDVKEDFETWIPKLSSRAIVLFHDTEVYDQNFGVHKYWTEISSKYPSFNFKHGHGLGVLFYGIDVPEGMKDIISRLHDDIFMTIFKDYFSLAGHQIAHIFHLKIEQNLRNQALEEELQNPFIKMKRAIKVFLMLAMAKITFGNLSKRMQKSARKQYWL